MHDSSANNNKSGFVFWVIINFKNKKLRRSDIIESQDDFSHNYANKAIERQYNYTSIDVVFQTG